EETSTPVTSSVGSENSEGTSESEGKGHGICGPAFLVSLAVVPLILGRWRK
ncbi:MAG: CGP-CTERM sorting domain-containing protein, partial [Thermococcus sp.]|nr:CGP-CTERM sorting domain-containing protein [Thermococcus sp.]